MTARTYLWMFPIYGSIILFEPVHEKIRIWPVWMRATVWMMINFAVEYFTGWLLLQAIGMVPWDYSQAIFNIQGLIRLDYAPVWFAAGLLYEKIHDCLGRIRLYQ